MIGQLHLEDDVGSVHQTNQPLWDWSDIFQFFAHEYRLWYPAYVEANPPPGSAAEDVAGAMALRHTTPHLTLASPRSCQSQPIQAWISNPKASQAMDLLGQVEAPRVAWFASQDSRFWDDNLELFPDTSTFPQRAREVLCMEQVFPLPEPIQHALIETFCNPTYTTVAKTNPANKDCLAKIFLG